MYESISIDDFEELMKKEFLNIIDVREPDEYASGHIEEAVLVPLQTLSEKISDFDPEETYYVICHSGGRSAVACEFMTTEGFKVSNVLGGMMAWSGKTV